MEKKYFSDEQVLELQNNPYIKKVSNKAITYTDEFKRLFMEKYEAGNTPSCILRELGFDTTVLGRKRISGIVERTRKYVIRNGDCHDTRKDASGRPSVKDLTETERIAKLEHQVKLLKQENEYLKKIGFLDRQAEWKEKRKLRRKKNSYSLKK